MNVSATPSAHNSDKISAGILLDNSSETIS